MSPGKMVGIASNFIISLVAKPTKQKERNKNNFKN